MGRQRAARAFERFFGLEPPCELGMLTNLTPGDFTAVKRQLRHAPAQSAHKIAKRLRDETSWRRERPQIGF